LPATAAQVFGPNTVDPGFNSTGEKTLLTMSTTLPAGGKNVIIAVFMPNGAVSIDALGYFLIKKGSTIISRTFTTSTLNFGAGRAKPIMLLAVDDNPTGSDTYVFNVNITTAATSTALVHVQGIVIKTDGDANWVNNSVAVSIASGATSSVVSLSTGYATNSKVVALAFVNYFAASFSGYLTTGDVRIVMDTTVISSNEFKFAADVEKYSGVFNLAGLVTVPTASQTWKVEIYNRSTGTISCYAILVTFPVSDGMFLDTAAVALSNGVQVTVGSLSTTLRGDVVVLGLGAILNTNSGDVTALNAGDMVLQKDNTTLDQVNNQVSFFLERDGYTGTSGILPLIRVDTGVTNPSYQIKMTARAAGISGEAKILAFVLGVDIKKVFGETLQLLENIILKRGRFRLMSENISIGEASINLRSLFRGISEQVNLVENVVRVRNLARIILESINLSEVMVLLRRLVRVLTEVTNLNEVFRSVRNRFKVSNETINLLESVRVSMLRLRILVESVNIIENIGKALGRTRVVNEFVNLLEAVGSFKSKVLRIIENINLSETFISIKGKLWVQVEQVRISEVFLRLRNRVRVIVEQLNLSELVGGLRNRFRLVGEVINISESKFLSRVWVRIQGEVVSISELGIKVLGKVKVIVENVRIVEAHLFKLVKTYIKRLKSIVRGMTKSGLEGSSKGGEL
jgi:hypothetical protein